MFTLCIYENLLATSIRKEDSDTWIAEWRRKGKEGALLTPMVVLEKRGGQEMSRHTSASPSSPLNPSLKVESTGMLSIIDCM